MKPTPDPQAELPANPCGYHFHDTIRPRAMTELTPYVFTSLTVPALMDAEFDLLCDSVRIRGIEEPLHVTLDGRVVDGKARLRAAALVGLNHVPTYTLEALGEPQYAFWAAYRNLSQRPRYVPRKRLTLLTWMLPILETHAKASQQATRFGSETQRAAHAACGLFYLFRPAANPEQSPHRRHGAITYFVHNPQTNLVKIGRTAALDGRLTTLEAACGTPLVLIGTLEGNLERDYHHRFARHRKRGEWFQVGPDLAVEVEALFGYRIRSALDALDSIRSPRPHAGRQRWGRQG